MARLDKEQQATMMGMVYIMDYARKNGFEAAEMELKRRGYTNMPIRCPDSQLSKAIHDISENVYQMMLVAMLYAAHDEFGFGPDRLKRLKSKFNHLVENTYDLDYMSCHYITMADYANELMEKYGVLFDLAKIERLQESFDKKEPNYRMCNVDRVLEELKKAGYEEAAAFLERKLA